MRLVCFVDTSIGVGRGQRFKSARPNQCFSVWRKLFRTRGYAFELACRLIQEVSNNPNI